MSSRNSLKLSHQLKLKTKRVEGKCTQNRGNHTQKILVLFVYSETSELNANKIEAESSRIENAEKVRRMNFDCLNFFQIFMIRLRVSFALKSIGSNGSIRVESNNQKRKAKNRIEFRSSGVSQQIAPKFLCDCFCVYFSLFDKLKLIFFVFPCMFKFKMILFQLVLQSFHSIYH
jgi:hypothetical protein